MGQLHLLDYVFLLEAQLLKVDGSLLERGPDRDALGDGAEFGPLKFVKEVIVLVEQVLLLVDIIGDCQMNFPNEATIVLCVDEDVPGPLVEPVLDQHYFKLGVVTF